MKTTFRTAVLMAFAMAAPLAHAQAPASPSAPAGTRAFGAGTPGGKLLTRDELRACLALQEQIKARGPELERDKAELQREKAALQEAGEALMAVREAFERGRQEEAAPFKAKAEAHTQRINDFNQRTAELAELDKQGGSRAGRADRLRRQLEAEHAGLKKDEQALRAEMDTFNRTNADAAKAINERAAAHEQGVRAWNERNDAFTDRVQAFRGTDERWLSDCADRRYDELDETAIRQGK